jgi:type I restriction enzyme S subunit
MKDSGVAWLGEVPEHWATLPLKRWVSMNRSVLPESTPPSFEFRYLDIGSVGTGVLTARPQRLRFAAAPSRARRVVRDGDTLISTVRTYLKAVYFVDRDSEDLVCSTGFAVLTPTARTVPRFVSYLCQSSAFTDRVTADSIGIAYPAIAETKLGSFHVAVPSLPEQAAIVRFLDHADRRIRRYIRAKQKLIKLLEEQKQAIIHRAVTRGLDPNVRLKPSGVEWLGEVPEHWKVRRLKDVAGVQTGLTLGKAYLGSSTKSYPYLRVANVQVGRVDLRHVKHIDVPEREALGAMLRSGDVLMTEGGDIDKLGRGCVWHAEIPVCLHQNHVFAVRCDRTLLLPEFLVGLMASQHGRTYFQLTAKQTTNLAATNSTTLRAFPILWPPLGEQQAIIDDIERQTVAVSKAVEDAQREISLLREFRTRLIADVVTGKLDVREAAARLPQEAEEPGPLDELSADAEGDEAMSDDADATAEEADA